MSLYFFMFITAVCFLFLLSKTSLLSRTSPNYFCQSILPKKKGSGNFKFLIKTTDWPLWKNAIFATSLNRCFYSLERPVFFIKLYQTLFLGVSGARQTPTLFYIQPHGVRLSVRYHYIILRHFYQQDDQGFRFRPDAGCNVRLFDM